MASIDGESSPTQRTYGRGMIEGLKLAGVENPGDVMNNARLKAKEDGLNSAFRKVYEAIPLVGVIGIPDIIGTLRSNGKNIDHQTVKAAIGELLDKGLIRNVQDKYQRIAQKPVIVKTPTPVSEPDPKPEVKTHGECDPLDRMVSIEQAIKNASENLLKIADDVADTALDVGRFVERIRNDNAKVSQLKELLKSL